MHEFSTEHRRSGQSILKRRYYNLISDRFLHATEWTNKFLAVDDVQVDFHVANNFRPWWGHGAAAPGPHQINFFFHPNHFYLRDNQYGGQVRFSASVAHELHHVMRWRGPGYGETLGEMAVSEGLAMKFQSETGHPDFIDEPRFSGEQMLAIIENAKPFLDIHMREDLTFRNQKGEFIDRYALGLALVDGWSKYTGLTAASAHNISAEDILSPHRAGTRAAASVACSLC